MDVIETKDLGVVLNGKIILDKIDVRAAGRQIVGIVGPNGSGKSTLLKCIYRVLKPTKGAILLDGRELRQFSVRQSAQAIAVVTQHHSFDFDFTVLQVVLMGRSPHKRAFERDNALDYRIARNALQTVGMADKEQRIFSTLSGGEQQRVVVARALAQQTDCLILDEPLNHLDIQYQLQIMELLRSLDRTVLLAVHDLNLAAAYCDFLFALRDGTVVGYGTPKDLLTPAFIEMLYGVKAQVQLDENGIPFVLFRSARKEKFV